MMTELQKVRKELEGSFQLEDGVFYNLPERYAEDLIERAIAVSHEIQASFKISVYGKIFTVNKKYPLAA